MLLTKFQIVIAYVSLSVPFRNRSFITETDLGRSEDRFIINSLHTKLQFHCYWPKKLSKIPETNAEKYIISFLQITLSSMGIPLALRL